MSKNKRQEIVDKICEDFGNTKVLSKENIVEYLVHIRDFYAKFALETAKNGGRPTGMLAALDIIDRSQKLMEKYGIEEQKHSDAPIILNLDEELEEREDIEA